MALLILGGDFIQNFAIALICGVIVGTYSSIYVLCNNLILMNLNFEDLAIKKSETYDDGMPKKKGRSEDLPKFSTIAQLSRMFYATVNTVL